MTAKLEELGVPAADVLRRAGLPVSLLRQPKLLLTTGEFFALWRAIGEAATDPALGLKLGTEDRIERYDAVGVAALCARSGGDSLERMARYKQLTCPEEIRVQRGAETVVQFRWLLAKESEPTILTDVCFAWV